jgi:sterol desaturase/sphingolipid hydroxylase (fatty acid hydroxylase superfamily)
MGRAIAIATPAFFLLMLLEYAWGRAREHNTYRLNDSVNSLSLGVLSQLSNLFTTALRVGVYAFACAHLAIWKLRADVAWVWVLAIVFYDFCYYWYHRLGHECAVLWAAHVAHHQSQEFNLSTALRQTSTGALLGWVFYLPMAIVGIPPNVFAAVALIDLLYQYWIHTEHVRKLGWADRVLATPSNHRVHHAVNDRYLDRNYGGILILWDRLFGTFVEEREPCVYGTRSPLDSWDPLWANVEVYARLARKSASLPRWRDRILIWFKPPGWEPAPTGGEPWQSTSYDHARAMRFDPPMTSRVRRFALVQMIVAIVATLPLLWFADELSARRLSASTLAIAVWLWLVGAMMQGRMRVRTALLLQFVVAAATSSFGPAEAAGARDNKTVLSANTAQAVFRENRMTPPRGWKPNDCTHRSRHVREIPIFWPLTRRPGKSSRN